MLQQHYRQLDEHLRKLADAIPELGEHSDIASSFAEFLAEQEFGLAFDLVTYFLNEWSITPTPSAREHMHFLSEAMNLRNHD